ncbi:MAG: hypothetical protein N3A57_02870 [Negativicutes bacterium]|nr:hypothetical protein [Negativicutes bacterium]
MGRRTKPTIWGLLAVCPWLGLLPVPALAGQWLALDPRPAGLLLVAMAASGRQTVLVAAYFFAVGWLVGNDLSAGPALCHLLVIGAGRLLATRMEIGSVGGFMLLATGLSLPELAVLIGSGWRGQEVYAMAGRGMVFVVSQAVWATVLYYGGGRRMLEERK